MSITCTMEPSGSLMTDYYWLGVYWATIMVIVYPIGIPLLFYLLLYKCKNEIIERDEPIGNDNILAREDMTPIERYQQAENEIVHVFQNPIVRVKQIEMAVLEKQREDIKLRDDYKLKKMKEVENKKLKKKQLLLQQQGNTNTTTTKKLTLSEMNDMQRMIEEQLHKKELKRQKKCNKDSDEDSDSSDDSGYVLYCIVLYCIVLYCIVLYTVL
jgi:hypothetical protein